MLEDALAAFVCSFVHFLVGYILKAANILAAESISIAFFMSAMQETVWELVALLQLQVAWACRNKVNSRLFIFVGDTWGCATSYLLLFQQ